MRRNRQTIHPNNYIRMFTIALVGLSAVPFGSNRPVFWALWCVAAVTVLSVYVAQTLIGRQRPRLSVGVTRIELVLYTSFISVMILQLMPLAGFLDLDCPVSNCGEFDQLSMAPGDTWLAILRWITYGIVFYLTAQACLRESQGFIFLMAVIVIATIISIYSIMAITIFNDTILIADKIYYKGDATGTFVNRNSFATFLGLACMAAFSLLLSQERDRFGSPRISRQNKAYLAAMLLTLSIAIVMTQSRMGIFATAVGAIVVLALQFPRGRTARWSLAVGVISVVGTLVVYGGGLVDRVLILERSVENRLELYRQVSSMIRDRPLIGYGAGSFRAVFPVFHEASLDVGLTWEYAHSTYLSLWAEMGLIAGSLPLVLVALINIGMLAHGWSGGRLSALSSAAVGASFLVALHSVVDFSLEMQGVAMLYTAVLAVGSASAFARRVS